MANEQLFEEMRLKVNAFIEDENTCGYALNDNFREVPTHFWGYFAFFPKIPLMIEGGPFIRYSTDPARGLLPEQILSLKLPVRIRRLNVVSDHAQRAEAEADCIAKGWPSIVLAVGEEIDSQNDVQTLFCVAGMTPEQGLETVQEIAGEAKAGRN